jgi:hypothetical protein
MVKWSASFRVQIMCGVRDKEWEVVWEGIKRTCMDLDAV